MESGWDTPLRSSWVALAVWDPFCTMPAALWARTGVVAIMQAAAMQTTLATWMVTPGLSLFG